MNEGNLSIDPLFAEREVITESEVTTPETVSALKAPRKRGATRRLPAPPKEASPLKVSGTETATEQDAWANYLLNQARCLLQTKQAEVAQRQAELAQRQAEAELLHRLIELAHRPPSAASDLTSQFEQAQQQIAGLQSANAQLQAQWEKAGQELANATEAASLLRVEGEKLRNELETEKAARHIEQKQFKEQIEREIKYEVEGFKGKLAGKLKPVFDQKSTTDDHPADTELAEFLRGWFHDLEEKLAESGVQVSRRT